MSSILTSSGRGFSNLSLHVFSLFCFGFFEHSLAFLLAPMGSMPGSALVLCFWQVYCAWRQNCRLRSLRTGTIPVSIFFTPVCKIRKPLCWQVLAEDDASWIICFSWLDARAKISKNHLQRKFPKFAFITLLFSLDGIWTVSGLRTSKSNNNNNNQGKELVRPIGWSCKLGGPPVVVTFWFSCASFLCLAFFLFTFPSLASTVKAKNWGLLWA